nr:hypothetical protein [Candidatus Mycoplasma haematolamae]
MAIGFAGTGAAFGSGYGAYELTPKSWMRVGPGRSSQSRQETQVSGTNAQGSPSQQEDSARQTVKLTSCHRPVPFGGSQSCDVTVVR